MQSDNDILKHFKDNLKKSNSGLGEQYTQNEVNQSYYTGNPEINESYLDFDRSEMVNINRVQPYVNAIAGFMAQNRREAKYIAQIPDNQSQVMYSKYSTEFSRYNRDNANASHIETRQDIDLLVCGYGVVDTNLSVEDGYSTEDPNSEIIMERVDPNHVGWDPSARQINLLDAKYVWRKKLFYRDEVESLFTDQNDDEVEESEFEAATNDFQEPSYWPEGGVYNKIAEYDIDRSSDMVNVYYYQWYENEYYYRCANPLYLTYDPMTRAFLEMKINMAMEDNEDDDFNLNPESQYLVLNKTQYQDLKSSFREAGIDVEFVRERRKVFYTAIISGETIFKKYKNLAQNGFTLKFKTGYYDEQRGIWYAVVNSLREPADYYNKSLTEMIYILSTRSKGGLLFEEGATDDPAGLEEKYALSGASIELNEGGLAKIRPKNEGATPTGYENLVTISDQAINDVTGVDKAFLGNLESKQETALLQRQRIKQVMSGLAIYFDAITLYQKEHARLMLPLMKYLSSISEGKMFRILGENGAIEYAMISQQNFVDKYDTVIEEAPESAMQKQENASMLTTLAQSLAQIGDLKAAKQVYLTGLNYLPIDPEDRLKIAEAINLEEPVDPRMVQQLQQQVQKLMSEKEQAEVAKDIADKNLKEAQIAKTMADAAKIESERVQKETETAIMSTYPVDRIDVNV